MKQLSLKVSDPDALKKIPLEPGCYLFYDKSGTILYVGKAKALRKRLSSYLTNSCQKPDKTALMLKKAAYFEFIVTISEKEALLLEAELIRKHRPKYNIHWRDDKAYPFLRLNIQSKYPRLSVVRKRKRDGALYFGPYESSQAVKETLRFISSNFGLRTCTDHTMKTRSRPCLQFQIKKCTAPCCQKISYEEYRDRVAQVKLFLEGKTAPLIKNLTNQMEAAAKNFAFEKAARLRDKIAAIKRISEAQTVVASMDANWDLIALARKVTKGFIGVLRIREGIIQGQEIHALNIPADETDHSLISFFIKHYYMETLPPPEIIVDKGLPDKEVLEGLLKDISGNKVKIKWSVRSHRSRLLKMAKQNALVALNTFIEQQETWKKTETAIKKLLNVKKNINYVEGLDISNTSGKQTIGSLVAFKDGKPYKNRYRRYNITEIEGPDDYEALRLMIRRRLASQNLPDLFIIDGGKGQLSAVAEVIYNEAGLENISLLSLAKEHGDGQEKIYIYGETAPRFLPNHHPALLFMQRVRDEAHRFGILQHRKKRDKKGLSTILKAIPGIGPAREKALLKHFGSLKRLKQASEADIASIPSIPHKLAQRIHEHLKDSFHG